MSGCGCSALDGIAVARLDPAMSRAQSAAELVRYYREMVKTAERDLARAVHEDLADGVPVARIARDAGLSRERIYQIRDGRR